MKLIDHYHNRRAEDCWIEQGYILSILNNGLVGIFNAYYPSFNTFTAEDIGQILGGN